MPFSHSSVAALCPHPRNVDEAVMARLRDNGGVLALSFVASFVSTRFWEWTQAASTYRTEIGAPTHTPCLGRSARRR